MGVSDGPEMIALPSPRIAILCPTRDRPRELARLLESIQVSSERADVLTYIDDDQVDLYAGIDGITRMVGPRVGPVAAANALVEANPGYAVYGLLTDDCVVTTPGWDDWLIDAIDYFPRRVAVISPHHNNGDHVDMPFCSSEWIEAVGWYACPDAYHYVWPIITGLIGERTAICHAPEGQFHIEHDYIEGTYPERRARDYEAFFNFVSLKLPWSIAKVRSAMFDEEPVAERNGVA